MAVGIPLTVACMINIIFCLCCFYRRRTRQRIADAQRAFAMQQQQQTVPVRLVYVATNPAAIPSGPGIAPGQPYPYMQPSGPQQFVQPAFTAPPVPEHKDNPSSPSSQQQEDAPPSYYEATGGEQ